MSEDRFCVAWAAQAGAPLLAEQGPSETGRSLFAALERTLLGRREITSPAILTYGDGTAALVAVIQAETPGVAVDRSHQVFEEAIATASREVAPEAPIALELLPRATAEWLT